MCIALDDLNTAHEDYRDSDADAKFAQLLLDLLKNEQLLSY